MTTSNASPFSLARGIAMTAVGGAVLLVAIDFFSSDATPAGPATELIERRLRSVANIDLFTSVYDPGTDLRVSTGTAYADARALADGRVANRWCYVEHEHRASPFAARIELGRQSGDEPPVFTVTGVASDQAKQLGLPADALAALAHRDCRFAS